MMLLPQSKKTLAADIVLPLIAISGVVLRIFSRKEKRVPLKADDYTIIIALTLAVAACASGIYADVINIYTTPINELSRDQWSEHEKLIYIDILLLHTTYGITKLSLILFYKRIFVIKWFQTTGNVFMSVVVAWVLAAIFTQVFSAWPVDSWWNFRGNPEPLLWQPRIQWQLFLFIMAVINLLLDFFTLCLPIPIIQSLHINRKRKVSLTAIFALGFFCIGASVVRIYYTNLLREVVWNPAISPLTVAKMSSWNDMWAHIEACISIFCACLPTMAPLAARLGKSDILRATMSSISRSWGTTRSFFKSFGGKSLGSSSFKSSPTNTWYSLQNRSGEPEEPKSSGLGDEESLVPDPETIRVQKSFHSRVVFEERH